MEPCSTSSPSGWCCDRFGSTMSPAFAAYRSDPDVARYQSWQIPYPPAEANGSSRPSGTPSSAGRASGCSWAPSTGSPARCAATARCTSWPTSRDRRGRRHLRARAPGHGPGERGPRRRGDPVVRGSTGSTGSRPGRRPQRRRPPPARAPRPPVRGPPRRGRLVQGRVDHAAHLRGPAPDWITPRRPRPMVESPVLEGPRVRIEPIGPERARALLAGRPEPGLGWEEGFPRRRCSPACSG